MTTSIEATDDVRGGEPVLEGTRIPVIDIVDVYRAVDGDEYETAATFDIDVTAVYAALRYFHDNTDEMRRWMDDRGISNLGSDERPVQAT